MSWVRASLKSIKRMIKKGNAKKAGELITEHANHVERIQNVVIPGIQATIKEYHELMVKTLPNPKPIYDYEWNEFPDNKIPENLKVDALGRLEELKDVMDKLEANTRLLIIKEKEMD